MSFHSLSTFCFLFPLPCLHLKLFQALPNSSSTYKSWTIKPDTYSSRIFSTKASAVDKYKLSESENLVKSLKAQYPNLSESGIPTGGVIKSELYRIDDKFTGEDKSLYPSFQRDISIALAQNADRYGTLQSQISLIYQNLGSGPKSFLDRYLSDNGQFMFKTLSAVWDVLDISYKNLNEEDDTREMLNRHRQGSKPFGMFLAEFQRLHNLSGITDDKTLISCMRNGVSSDLRSCISQHQDIRKKYTFDEYVALCKDCVIRLELERPSNQHPFDQIPSRVSNMIPRGGHQTQFKSKYQISSQVPMVSSPIASGANIIPLS